MTTEQRFQIGTRYLTRGSNPRKPPLVHTVVDVHRTFNSRGELVKLRYVSEHIFCGETIKEFDVCDTTIARGDPMAPELNGNAPC